MAVILYDGSAELLAGLTADFEAVQVADYVSVHAQITAAIHNQKNIKVKVSHPTVASWLKSLADRYGTEYVRIEKLTYRQRLQSLWNVDVPAWVTEEQIARTHLLDYRLAAQPGRSFEDFILETFFSPWLAQPQIPLARLVELLRTLEPRQWTESLQRPLLGDVCMARLAQWEQQARNPGEKLLVEWLRQSPEILARQLALLKVLANYPSEVGQRVMGANFPMLAEMNLELDGLEVNEGLAAPALDHLRVHLEKLVRSEDPQAAIFAILEQSSGYLEVEFDALHRLLRHPDFDVQPPLIRQARAHFASLNRRPNLEQSLADLDLLIHRPPPPQPDPDPAHPWSENEWIAWATKSYLPYRFWLEEIGQLSGDVVEYARQYADWLYSRYPALRLNSPVMLYQTLPGLREQLSRPAPVLVLVLDNFNAKFVADLTRYMLAENFYNEQTSFAISMLPSCTEISKKCLLSGQPEPFPGTAYEKMVENTWSKVLPGRKVRYLPHIGALRAIKRREHDVYILNYLPLDIAFHQDEEQMGISHAQAARSYLHAVAKDVRAFAERIGAERDLIVIVTSDHGSTRIPADAPNSIDARLFAGRVEDQHHRYVSISDSELKQLPDHVQYQCYVFQRERFGLDQNYLSAREYYRFVPTTASVYIHGGLTPEETLVPVLVFTPLTITPKPLSVNLLHKEFYYERRSQIQIEIVNTNAYLCQKVRVDIQNPGVESLPVSLEDIEALDQRAAIIEARFRRSYGRQEKLQLYLSYTFLGQPHQQHVELDTQMRSMMQSAFDLRDLH